jgi:hypothetical protein|tara:strand:+ start:50 stop:229 length:180 start_codon:yes stop_codon:yes gene_type:complete
MDRKNILSEGFFDFLKKFKTNKLTKKEKQLMSDPKFRQKYKKAEESVDDLLNFTKNLKF